MKRWPSLMSDRRPDLLRPVYDLLDGADGFVSLEVNPHKAYDTAATSPRCAGLPRR